MNRKNQMAFYEEIPTDVTDDSSTSDVVDDLNNDNADLDKPNGSEADNDTGADDEGKKPVPYSRFKEVLEDSKTTKSQLAEMATKIEDLQKVKAQVAKADDASEDEDTGLSKEGKAILKKNGFMTEEEFKAREDQLLAKIAGRQAYEKDANETASWAKKQGYPDFDLEAVEKHAKDKFGGITSPASMKAAYKDLHEEAITEVIAKRAIAQAGKPKASAEKPGASSGKGEPSKAPAKGDMKARTESVLDRLEAEGKITKV